MRRLFVLNHQTAYTAKPAVIAAFVLSSPVPHIPCNQRDNDEVVETETQQTDADGN